ncbi:HlyC/CorC family transporter [Salinibacterium sp. NSLL150]|uniref:hemolysin family protein n=1 Tax=unclassified Salinibacterium TaxID=2632331 RepID=UPI0018CD4C7A|nr:MULTISPECIES: hemolysin family protein [unclassified Salinibacterium]MBH0098917.1 HlyC/CorC family transporter [Salinibacterium sp. NSLL35]MBH0101672.1 HlyC/CorC family transporter [Salinibacterium sp. NSLL150]MBH0104431.1 HlyC/CorC family transporter [Salinibacterium sp. NSLL16]MBH0107192.1 HlyC/CorC family transporter [Salinibacterium sp. NSLL17]
MLIGIFITVAILLVSLGGLLAAADSALTVMSRSDLVELAGRSRAQKSIMAISVDTGAHINALNFMRIVVETTAAVLVTLVFASAFEQWWLVLLLSALIMTGASFVLVGSSPRSVGRAHSRKVLQISATLVRSIRVILGPIADALVALGNRVTPGRPRTATFSSEEQLLSMVDEAAEHEVLDQDDRDLIHSIFEFNSTVVREVMIPRTDMVTVEAEVTASAAMGLFLSRGVSRVPVIGEDIDQVMGVLYLRDVARVVYEQPAEADKLTTQELARPALFVPESQRADSLLRQMQLESNHLAMVVDEYGGIAGLVSLEDLIEELVGDISDEYDREVAEFEELTDGTFRVSARLPIDELGDLFGLELDDDEVDSVGGLIMKTLGRLPESGAVAHYSGLVLTAERTEGRRKRISTVLVSRDPWLDNQQDPRSNERENGESQ